MFYGCKAEDLPPHIYSTAQRAYKKMIDSRRDQSMIFLGRSGSGKTTNFKHALFYLSLAAGMFFYMINLFSPLKFHKDNKFRLCKVFNFIEP